MSQNPTNLDEVTAKVCQTGAVTSISSGTFSGNLIPEASQIAFATAPAAITGGEAPTEAEHNALRTFAVAVRDALVTAGIMLPS